MKSKILLLLTILFFTAHLWAQIPTNGLVANYPFNGNANDESGNGNNGTVNGATLTEDRFGNANSAYSFNGDYIKIAQANDFLFNDFTISAWFNYTASGGTTAIIGNPANSANEDAWILAFIAGQLQGYVYSGNYTNTSPITPNRWHLATFVKNGATAQLYLNTMLLTNITVPSTITYNQPRGLIIGADDDAGSDGNADNLFFNGMIDDISIYNRALSYSEIQDLYGGYTVVVYPKLTLSTNTVIAGQNISINGQDFTPYGNVTLQYYGAGGMYTENTTANAQGQFSYTYTAPSTNLDMSQNGLSAVKAIDDVTNNNSNIKSFFISNPINAHILTIQAPSSASPYNSIPITVQWTDKMINATNQTIGNTGQIAKTYKLDYSLNGGAWQTFLPSIAGAGFYNQLKTFSSQFVPSTSGSYQIRVTDNGNANNFDISNTFVVTLNNGSGFDITKEWDASGLPILFPPTGVCADGTSRIYIKVAKKTSNYKTIASVKFEVEDPSLGTQSLDLVGAVQNATVIPPSYSLEANNATQQNTTNSSPISGNYWFWYVAPKDFYRNGVDEFSGKREVKGTVTVTYTDNTVEPKEIMIEIVRPPLVLVHGLGGDEHTWDNFSFLDGFGNERKYIEEQYMFQAGVMPFEMCKDCSFSKNATFLLNINPTSLQPNTGIPFNTSFDRVLLRARNRGFAASKVDYVCHSMGGSMLRTAINRYNTQYYQPQGWFKNYEQGFVNKAITLNTPHNGSPVADYIADEFHNLPIHRRWELSRLYDLNTGVESYIKKEIDSDFIINLGDVYKCNASDAVNDLRAVGNGIRFNQTTVKNHTIAGKTELNLAAIANYTSFLTLGNIDANAMFDFALGFDINNMNDYITQKGYTDFFYDSDWVVPVNSQLAGKQQDPLDPTQFVLIGTDKNHINIHSIIESGNLTMDLLNASINSNNFANDFAKNTTPGGTLYKTTQTSSISEYIDTVKVKILSPINNPALYVDSTLIVQVLLKDTTNFKSLSVTFQGLMYHSTVLADTQTFSIQVNPNYLHNQKLFVTALYDSLGTNVYHHDIKDIMVLTDNTPVGLEVLPKTKVLFKGENYTPNIYALHSNYVTNIFANDINLAINVADTNVVVFNHSINRFVAKDTGSTFAVLDYSNFKDTIYFEISTNLDGTTGIEMPQNPAGAINAIVYPNPSNSDFNLEYVLPQNSNVEITVLNLMGQTIKTIKPEMQIEGTHKAKISMEGVANGLYLLNIKTDFGIFNTKLLKN